jgi:membrane fusion protein, multidrug efflux system
MSPPSAEPSSPSQPAPRPPSRGRRWLGSLLALLVVLALIGGARYLIKRSATPEGGPGAFAGASSTVGHAVARRDDLPILIDALGTVTPLATITLRPQVGGVLTEVHYTEGQMVAKDQLLARIDPRPYEQALASIRRRRLSSSSKAQ